MQSSRTFKLKRASYVVMGAIAALAAAQLAHAGAGWADNVDKAGVPFKQPTFYANSPMGVLAGHGPAGSAAPEGTPRDTGKALRKFVDNLPLVAGYVTNTNLLAANPIGPTGRIIPTAVKEDLSSAAGKALLLTTPTAHSLSYPDADYYEIAVVEYREQLHSDLPAVVKTVTAGVPGPVVTGGTTLRGYVQIATPNLPVNTKTTQLFYLNGKPILDNKGQPVFAVGDGPHYLGPIIDSTSGVPVRLRFDNYLPTGHYDPITKTRGGDTFIPTDLTMPGSGLGPKGAVDPNAPQPYERYTQNRTNIHLHGGDTPWISDGEPHDWITPAGENTMYPVGETTQNVPDMPDPGPGSQTLYYPNNQSARMEWYHDHSYGSTRIDVYAGIVSAFLIHDATEASLKAAGGALYGMDELPLIFEDKTFVPKDVLTEDTKWSTDAWGQYGDLWFPHVYEINQNPNSIDGTNPAGRWDYGPWFWPVFPAPLALPTGEYGNVSATQEQFSDTPLINGIAYPNLNVEPKAYRFRLLNASLQRYLNLGLYVAEPLSIGIRDGGANYPSTTSVSITADTNGLTPTATLFISPLGNEVVTIAAGGSGYTTASTVTFSGGGATTAATGHVTVDATGAITGVVIDTAGVGYTSAPSIAFGGPGSGASATVSLSGGQIQAIKLNPAPANKTYSYTSPPTVTLNDPSGAATPATLITSINTEVPMVDAVQPVVNPAYGLNTYDGRPGGIPDPAAIGPNIIQIGTEGGFLAQPNVIASTPISYQQLRRIVTVLNVLDHGLYVGPAERADFVIDFSQFAGKTLIMYNDCPAPNPGFDARVDYYTGDVDQTSTGGADVTMPGYGPNTRTIMRINIAATQAGGVAPAAAYDPTGTGGPLATALPKAFAASQDTPIVPESWQNAAYGTSYTDNVAHIYAGSYQQPTFTFNTGGVAQALASFRVDSAGAGYTIAPSVVLTGGFDPATGTPASAHAVLDVAGKRVQSIVIDNPGSGYTNAPIVALNGGDGIGASATAITSSTQSVFVQPKGIQELFESSYGRMNATFSVELPFTSVLTQTTIPVGYIDPPTDQIGDGETQFWKVTHNGVDTHVVHFHLFNVQVINRVAWDGTIVALDPAEFGWKETVKMNPLEDIYVAVRPKTPKQPFGVPQSIRALDPTQPIGATDGFSQVDPKTGLATTVTNQLFNFDWEYVWHCHILGHEENDFMRPVMFNFGTTQPAPVTNVVYSPSAQTVTWTDPTPVGVAATYLDKSNEQGFLIQRSDTVDKKGVQVWPDLPATTPQSAAQASMHPENVLPNVVAANATTWKDPVPATASTVYRVLGFNSAGYSPSYVATISGTGAAGTTAGLVTTALGTPNAPTQLKSKINAFVAATGSNPVGLTWTASPPPKVGFQIVREGGFTGNGTAIPNVTFSVPTVAGTTAYSFTDTTASEISAYTYNVYADNGTGTLSPGSLTTIATPYAVPPVVTGAASKLDSSGNNVTITWSMPPSTTPDAINVTATPHVTAFNVVRKDASGTLTTFSVQQVINPLAGTITLPATTYVDTAPVPGSSTYTIYAVNGDQTSLVAGPTSSTTISVTAAAAPGIQGLTAKALSTTSVVLNWASAPAGSVTSGVKISRFDGTATVALAVPAGVATSFVDTTAVQNTNYTYTVQWLNGVTAGNSQTATVTTPFAPALPVSALTAVATANKAGTVFTNTLNWAAGGPSTSYVVSSCVATAANGNCTNASTVFTQIATGLTAPTFADKGVTAGATYVYQVQAMNGPVNVSTPVVATVTDLFVAAPTVPKSSIVAAGSVVLSWTGSATAVTAPATMTYQIQRSTTGAAPWTTVGTVAGLTYTDTTVSLGNTYTYQIVAVETTATGITVPSAASPTTAVVYMVPATPTLSSLVSGADTAGTGSNTTTLNLAAIGGGAVSGYTISAYVNGSTTLTALTPTAASASSVTVPTTVGYNYTFVVNATNLLGPSALAASIPVQNGQPAVTTLTVTHPAGSATDSATVTWTPSVATVNGVGLTGARAYQVQWSTSANFSGTNGRTGGTVNVAAGTTGTVTTPITGIGRPGTVYVRVNAVTAGATLNGAVKSSAAP